MRSQTVALAAAAFLVMYTWVVLAASPAMARAWAGGAPPPSAAALRMELQALAGDLRRQNDAVSGVDRRLADFAKERRLVEGALEGQRHAAKTAVAGLLSELDFTENENRRAHEVWEAALRARPGPARAELDRLTVRTAAATPPPPPPTPSPPVFATLAERCAYYLEHGLGGSSPLIRVDIVRWPTPQGMQAPVAATTLDLAAGRAALQLSWPQVSSCVKVSVANEVLDPYVEDHILHGVHNGAVLPDKHGLQPCNAALAQAVDAAFGAATAPRADRIGAGTPIQVELRPRHHIATDAPYRGTLALPDACFAAMGGGGGQAAFDAARRGLAFEVPWQGQLQAVVVGDVVDNLHDGALVDGGRGGRIYLSHGSKWRGADVTVPGLRRILDGAFGPADAGQADAVFPIPGGAAMAFVLAPRAYAQNQYLQAVRRLSDIPYEMVEQGAAGGRQAVPVFEGVKIEDAVRPHAELVVDAPHGQAGWGAVPLAAFVAGGVVLRVRLVAGVFFTDDAAAPAALAAALAAVFGAAAADAPDAVVIDSPTAASVTLGRREIAALAWVAAGAPPQEGADALPIPETHRVLRFAIPESILETPSLHAPARCLLPRVRGCTYLTRSDPVAPYPSLTVALAQRMVFKWAVVGAGPSGMNGMGRVMDLWKGREDQVLWIDERGFQVGRLAGYHDVQSMNPCSEWRLYMKDFAAYAGYLDGAKQHPLLNPGGAVRNCRMGFLSHPLLEATRELRSKLVSYHGRVTDLHKVWLPGAAKTDASTDFVWSLRVGGGGGAPPPFVVTDGVVMAIGADNKENAWPLAQLPAEVPFSAGLHPGKLRTFINADTAAKQLRPGGKRVAVFGAGPSGVVALHNLALMPEVASVVHFTHGPRGDYTEVVPARPDGAALDVTRVKYDPSTLEGDLATVDYVLQCAGWVMPRSPYSGSLAVRKPHKAGTAAAAASDVFVGPKLFSVGVAGTGRGAVVGQTHVAVFFMTMLLAPTRRSATKLCSQVGDARGLAEDPDHAATCMRTRYPELRLEHLTPLLDSDEAAAGE